MIKKTLSILFFWIIFSLLYGQCIYIDNKSIKEPLLNIYFPYQWDKNKCKYDKVFCITKEKYLCPSNSVYYKSITDFLIQQGLWDYSKNLSERVINDTSKINPFIFYYDHPLNRDIYFNMKTNYNYGGLAPFYIQNKSLRKYFLFQYTDNLSKCDAPFCFYPKKPYNYFTENFFIKNSSLLLKDNNQIVFNITFNKKKCLDEFLKYFGKGDFIALDLFKVYLKYKDCSARGFGNFFSNVFLITPNESYTFFCEKKTNYIDCYYLNLKKGNKVYKIPPKNKTNPLLIYDLNTKKYKLAYNIGDIYVRGPKILYVPSYAIFLLNPLPKEENFNILYYNNIHKIVKLKGYDGYIVVFLKNSNTNFFIKEEIKKHSKESQLLDFSKFKIINLNLTYCEFKNFKFNCKRGDIKSLIGKIIIKNNTLKLYFKKPVVINNKLYTIEPLIVKVENKVFVKKLARALYFDEQNNTLTYKEIIKYYTNPLILKLFLNDTKEKDILRQIKVSKITRIENGSYEIIYIFPKFIDEGLVNVEGISLDLGRYYKLITIHENNREDFLIILEGMGFLIILYIILSYFSRKRERQKRDS